MLSITNVGYAGTISDESNVLITFARTGDAGAAGAQGATGSQGTTGTAGAQRSEEHTSELQSH